MRRFLVEVSVIDEEDLNTMGWVGRRATVGTAPLALVGCVLGALALSACGGGGGGGASSLTSFGWLRPSEPPQDWIRAEPASGGATLSYPSSFTTVKADTGAVSVAVTSSSPAYSAYLNVTPQQSTETLSNFATFRIGRLSEENLDVHEEAAKEAVDFRGGTGTCVVDDYTTRVGHNNYREIACLVSGRHGSYVIVAAALHDQWKKWSTALQQAVATFTVT
jgi:hypothetical protein